MFMLYVPESDVRSGDELRIEIMEYHACFGQKNLPTTGTYYWKSLTLYMYPIM